MGRADVYLQPAAEDSVLAHETVLAISRRHTTKATSVIAVDESGGEARAYLLAGDVVVKTQRPHRVRPRTSLAKEAFVLDLLAGPLGQRVPSVFGHGQFDTGEGVVEYLVMGRMPGQALSLHPHDGPSRSRLVGEVGALLAQLHAVPIDAATRDASRLPIDHAGVDLVRRLEAGFADLVDLLEDRPERWPSIASPDEVAAQAVGMLPAHFTPILLHSNPGPTHVFCDDDGSLTGLIDFGDSYLSHPALDLHRWPDPADRLTLRRGYLGGTVPSPDFDSAWTAAMIYTNMAVLASRPELARAAEADLTIRLGMKSRPDY